MILLEVLRGLDSDDDAFRVEAALRRFDVVRMLDSDLAIRAAGNCRILRERGVTILETVDLIIGTVCIEHGHALLTADRAFAPMAEHLGLVLV